jgi:hypothetical protein
MASDVAKLKLKSLWLTKGNKSLREALDDALRSAASSADNGAVASVTNNGTSVTYMRGGKIGVDSSVSAVVLLDELYDDAVTLLGSADDEWAIYQQMLKWLAPVNRYHINHSSVIR